MSDIRRRRRAKRRGIAEGTSVDLGRAAIRVCPRRFADFFRTHIAQRAVARLLVPPGRTPRCLVQSFPKPGGKTQISTQGGYAPRWSPDGKRLYFLPLATNQLSVVEVTAEERFEAGIPKVFLNGLSGQVRYDVAPDGRILTNATMEGFSPTLTVVLNWQSGRR